MYNSIPYTCVERGTCNVTDYIQSMYDSSPHYGDMWHDRTRAISNLLPQATLCGSYRHGGNAIVITRSCP